MIAAAAAAAALAVGLGAVTPGNRAARPDLQRVLDGLVEGPHRIAPGATAYVSGPHGTWAGSAGVADLATRAPMRADARMRLESVSKLWTATVILRLVGEGRMGLDDTVARWLPDLLPYGNRITVRRLLDHTSGMVDSNDIVQVPALYLRRLHDPALRARIASVARRVQRDPGFAFPARLWVDFAAALPLEFAPGATFHYSNIGYDVAGLIAERVGGADLATLVRRRIAGPLGLATAAYDPRPRIAGPHAHGYRVAAGRRLTDATSWTLGLGAGGGMVADAADEARFLRALMGGQILAPAQLAELKRPSSVTRYGLGTAIEDSGCAGTVYGHNGGGDGFESNVYVSGDGRRVAVLLLNGRTVGGRGDAAAVAAMQRLYCAA
ncbi:MAG: serine hydrolase domain-containing protein [Solirubrobacteraceae bacterium]